MHGLRLSHRHYPTKGWRTFCPYSQDLWNCPSDGARDWWVWCNSSFSTREVYHLLRRQEAPEDPQLVCRSQLVWKQQLPLKIRMFEWLLLRRHIMTRTLRHRFDQEAPAVCLLCNEAEEDYSHLFFQCSLAQAAWRAVGGGHGPSRHLLGRGILAIHQRWHIPLKGELATYLRHFMVSEATSKPGHFQG